jgi:hypothetical protein
LKSVGKNPRTCDWEVPGHKCNSNTDRLLYGEDSTVGCSWCLYSSLNTFRLTSEPPGKTQGIVEFALRFEKWFSSLVGNNIGQVIAVVADQLVPLQQTLGTSSRVDFAVGLESLMCCFNSCIGVFCDVVWCGGPYFAVTWVCVLMLLIGCDYIA